MFQAKEIMTTNVVTVNVDDTIDEAVALLLEHQISGVPVLDEAGAVVGIVTEFDLLELICDCRTERDRVGHYMSSDVCTVAEDEDWVGVADVFRSHHVRRLPVTRDGRLVGIISRHDLMRAIRNAREQLHNELARNVIST